MRDSVRRSTVELSCLSRPWLPSSFPNDRASQPPQLAAPALRTSYSRLSSAAISFHSSPSRLLMPAMSSSGLAAAGGREQIGRVVVEVCRLGSCGCCAQNAWQFKPQADPSYSPFTSARLACAKKK